MNSFFILLFISPPRTFTETLSVLVRTSHFWLGRVRSISSVPREEDVTGSRSRRPVDPDGAAGSLERTP